MEELEKNETSTQAEENTVSLASAQALADALAKIEVYTPTTWVDNSSPDIDAEHLNKPEQAIKRVTDALNSAVDVIKDLQSQVTKNADDISTVNNNLSNTDGRVTQLYSKVGTVSDNLGGFNFYFFNSRSQVYTISDILNNTAFCILGENYYSTVAKSSEKLYITNVIGNGNVTENNGIITINQTLKFGIIISNKKITIS